MRLEQPYNEDGLVLHYPLDEQAGLKAFDGSGRWPGTLTSGAYFNAQGCVFDGTNDYIDLGTPAPLNLHTSPMSVMCWVKHNVNGTFNYVISDFDSGATTSSVGIYRQSTNKWGFWHGSGAFMALSAKQSVVGQWTHLCGVRSGSTGSWNIKLYINGILDAQNSGATNPTAAVTCTIGKPGSYTGGLTMSGLISNMRIYNRALTMNEVQERFILERSKYL